jgi:hypothetical protein
MSFALLEATGDLPVFFAEHNFFTYKTKLRYLFSCRLRASGVSFPPDNHVVLCIFGRRVLARLEVSIVRNAVVMAIGLSMWMAWHLHISPQIFLSCALITGIC